ALPGLVLDVREEFLGTSPPHSGKANYTSGFGSIEPKVFTKFLWCDGKHRKSQPRFRLLRSQKSQRKQQLRPAALSGSFWKAGAGVETPRFGGKKRDSVIW